MPTRNRSDGPRPLTISWRASNASASALSPQAPYNEADLGTRTLAPVNEPEGELGRELQSFGDDVIDQRCDQKELECPEGCRLRILRRARELLQSDQHAQRGVQHSPDALCD